MKEQFQDFLTKLIAQMATGEFNVFVDCKDDKLFEARVIGYDEPMFRVKVEFLSDNLTKEEYVREKKTIGWGGYGPDDEVEYELVKRQVPVKVDEFLFTNIKLKKSPVDDEVTHRVFFGENIKRVVKAFKSDEKSSRDELLAATRRIIDSHKK